ncbi:MAG TPA: TonB-dependent receptor, partial [Gemmatimonadaceae bacterium]|nr:TonB-dependent receptor [Gemmatimonadaceae bacterium]
TAGQTVTIEMPLTVQPADLDAVVSTGQGGDISKRRIATTVDVISSETIEQSSAKRVDELLQTNLPGAEIKMTSGQEGTTSIIRTRGVNSVTMNSTPVIYVDGVRVDNLNTAATESMNISGAKYDGAATSAIADLPLENIDHVEFIPGGAATTIYGSDAANGVIQIFTKKGLPGATKAFFEIRTGYDTPDGQFNYFKRTDDILYRNGATQEYSGGVDGGVNALSYSFSGNVRASQSDRIDGDNSALGFRNALAADIGTKGRYQGSFSYNTSDVPRFRNGNSGGFQSLWFLEGGRSVAYGFDPNLDELDAADYAKLKFFVQRAEAEENNNVFERQFQTSQSLTFQPTASLTMHANFGVDNRYSNEKEITTNQFLIDTQAQPAGTTTQGSIQNYDRNFTGFTIDLGLQHHAEIGKLSMISAAGAQLFRNDDVQVAYTATNVRDGAETLAGAGVTASTDVSYLVANYGVFGQTNLSWLDRYTAELGLRADKNTAFGTTVGAQLYPKVGLVYALSSEPWMQGIIDRGILSDLRLRAAYGEAGTFPTAFAADRTIALSAFQGQQAATFGNPGNPDLKPERTATKEAGIDLGLLKDRAVFGLGGYIANTHDALINAPPAPSTGETSQLANVGEIANRGLETRVTLVPITSKNLRLTLTGSFNTLHNVVTDTHGTAPFAISGLTANAVQSVVQQGFPIGYLRGSKGVFDSTGHVTIIPNTYLGNPTPTKFGNFSASLAVGSHLTFSADGSYQWGAQESSFDAGFRYLNGVDGTANDIPAAALAQYGGNRATIWLLVSNAFIQNTNFVELRHLSVDYRIASGRFLPPGTNDMRIGFSVSRPFEWAASKFDPETDLSGAMAQGGATVGGINYSTDTQPRTFLLTLRFGF